MAADIGPEDALYVGTWGYGTEIPAQVMRITDDGRQSVYVDGLQGQVRAIAFAQNLPIDPGAVAVDSQGDVYFTSPSGIYRIYRES